VILFINARPVPAPDGQAPGRRRLRDSRALRLLSAAGRSDGLPLRGERADGALLVQGGRALPRGHDGRGQR